MSNDLSPPSPERFGLASFAEILPSRAPIVGEDPGSFQDFHDGLMRALAPFTPYECVIAENLIAIEWELVQHRRMRDAGLRKDVREAVCRAAVEREQDKLDEARFADWYKFVSEGGDERDWKDPFEFDSEAAEKLGANLAARATSHDREAQAEAVAEILEMGITPVEVMSEAYTNPLNPAERHDTKIQELERRRREVKRDYDALQKARPINGEVIEA